MKVRVFRDYGVFGIKIVCSPHGEAVLRYRRRIPSTWRKGYFEEKTYIQRFSPDYMQELVPKLLQLNNQTRENAMREAVFNWLLVTCLTNTPMEESA